jgi:hypothetical protein
LEKANSRFAGISGSRLLFDRRDIISKLKGEPFEYFYKQKEGVKFDNIFLSIFKSEVAVWTPGIARKT